MWNSIAATGNLCDPCLAALDKPDIGSPTPILDVRPRAEFEIGHRKGAVNIPLAELAERIHELPPPHQPLLIIDSDSRRSRWAVSRLRARGRQLVVSITSRSIEDDVDIEEGPSVARLWSPHRLLQRALDLIEAELGSLVGLRVVDVACGTGRDAVFMASKGLLVDAWDNLPDAIARCRDLARRNSVEVNAEVRNVLSGSNFAPKSYDIITCFNFLDRQFMAEIAQGVRPGGYVVYETFTTEQRRQFGKPKSDRHLLNSGELRGYFADWRILHFSESLASPRRFVASLIANKIKDERT